MKKSSAPEDAENRRLSGEGVTSPGSPVRGERARGGMASQRFYDFLPVVDMHGISNLLRSNHFVRKAIWIAFLIGLTAVCAWQLSGVIQTFIDAPTATNFEYVFERRLDFPAVTMCNVNPFRRSKISKINSDDFKEFYNRTSQGRKGAGVRKKNSANSGSSGNSPSPSGSSGGTDNFTWDDIDYDSSREDFDNSQEFYAKYMSLEGDDQTTIGYSLNDMMIDCSWAGKSCSPINFTRSTNPRFGNCFSFNVKNAYDEAVKKTSSPGPLHGLSVMLYIDQGDYFHEVADSAGIKVIVHNQDVMPFPQDHGLLVAPGFQTQIGIRKVSIERMSSPHGACENLTTAEALARDAHVEMLYGVKYTSQGCEKTCLQKAIVETCGCKYAMYAFTGGAFNNTNVPTAPFCTLTNTESQTCIENVERLFYMDQLTCDPPCPIICSENLFPTTSTSSGWPALAKEEDIKMMIAEVNPKLGQIIMKMSDMEAREFLHYNFLKLNVFYQDMMFQRIVTEEGYSWQEMVSDIGGTVELYVGASIVTFFQLIEIVIDLALIGIRGKLTG
ncbi:amiloride-sensitive sodium channel subunit gamma-like [Lineus longissimus]|uniref:amiloride-sensitive sodium channel subunit gamma-like n=1 Tax=Lineus longissimus TaxID=88925 RepID=UPI00315D871A